MSKQFVKPDIEQLVLLFGFWPTLELVLTAGPLLKGKWNQITTFQPKHKITKIGMLLDIGITLLRHLVLLKILHYILKLKNSPKN